MAPILAKSLLVATTVACRLAAALPQSEPGGAGAGGTRPPSSADPLLVDLGYGVYKGVYNSTSDLNIWKGIRYAAAPTGSNRWQAPQAPPANRTTIHHADAFGPICPQAYPAVPGVPFIPGNEDCLFLNVWAPAARGRGGPSSGGTGISSRTGNAERAEAGVAGGEGGSTPRLPVMVWIHGGGYGLGDGTQDMSEFINANDNGFLVVSIQYRLGAFGFLSSKEVKSKGVLNAGILDQRFALTWVQQHISKFGGDPARVTIAGESAGAGSVMLHAMASGGRLGSTLWQNGIAASPYDPGQYDFDAAWPTTRYYQFSALAGCPSSGDVFDCLKEKDTMTLQVANANMSASQVYGTWAFLPVTDGSYVQALPSVQLGKKMVNGKRMLVGNNANEGPLFVPPVISTLDDLKAWLGQEFPNFSPAQIQQILDTYPSSSAPASPSDILVETNGFGPPYAVNVSQVATGQQQRANNILGEATFVCPAYWLATAYASSSDKTSYLYQYSVPFAYHSADLTAYFGPATPNQGSVFVSAFRRIWGNFITTGNPQLAPAPGIPATWPAWTDDASPMLLNLNTTGGVPYRTQVLTWNVTQYMDPGLANNFTIADARAWEGGRGARCDFWKKIGPQVPE